jgi:hypothetical protein
MHLLVYLSQVNEIAAVHYVLGKCDDDTIQNGSHRSNEIPSPGMVNLLFRLSRFLRKDRLLFILALLVFLSQVYQIAGGHYHWHGEDAW